MQLEVTNALKAQREHAREQLQKHLKCASSLCYLLRHVSIDFFCFLGTCSLTCALWQYGVISAFVIGGQQCCKAAC